MSTISYPVAWLHEGGPRLVGAATVDAGGVLLSGREVGRRGYHQLRLGRGDVGEVELRRGGAAPTLGASVKGKPVVIELLMGGWGAAHQLGDELAKAALPIPSTSAPGGTTMTGKIAVVAHIRPGKKADLERLLEQGPPFDLQAEGFERHEVYIGDDDVVFVFAGRGAVSQIQRMAGSKALFSHVIKMGGVLSAPRLLTSTFEWRREPAVHGRTVSGR